MTAHIRARGEGLIYPYRNGRYAAYVWSPPWAATGAAAMGDRRHPPADPRPLDRELHHTAARHRVATRSPRLSDDLAWRLREVIAPFAKPKTTVT